MDCLQEPTLPYDIYCLNAVVFLMVFRLNNDDLFWIDNTLIISSFYSLSSYLQLKIFNIFLHIINIFCFFLKSKQRLLLNE